MLSAVPQGAADFFIGGQNSLPAKWCKVPKDHKVANVFKDPKDLSVPKVSKVPKKQKTRRKTSRRSSILPFDKQNKNIGGKTTYIFVINID